MRNATYILQTSFVLQTLSIKSKSIHGNEYDVNCLVYLVFRQIFVPKDSGSTIYIF